MTSGAQRLGEHLARPPPRAWAAGETPQPFAQAVRQRDIPIHARTPAGFSPTSTFISCERIASPTPPPG